jgi:hypothetical protein
MNDHFLNFTGLCTFNQPGLNRLMIRAPEIRRYVARFLADKIDADHFEDWIVRNTWNIHGQGDESFQKLAYAADSVLAGYSSGQIDESALRRKLMAFASCAEEILTASADPPPRAA